jgi:hypothetical protein
MTRLRSAFTVLLSALLIVTFQQMAAARGMSPAVGEAVLCLGGVQVSVAVDASGAPTKPGHFCPDCTIHAATDLGGITIPPAELPQKPAVFGVAGVFAVRASRPETLRARGPPSFA